MKNEDDIVKRGEVGEEVFLSWLLEQELPFLGIAQEPDKFSSLFSQGVKRPDFLLLLPSIGMIAVDAKNYTFFKGVFTLNLNKEVRKMIAFERVFRIPVWFAYMHEGKKMWFWISGLRAIEVGEVRVNGETKEQFLAIKKEHFAAVRKKEDLGQLLTQSLKSPQRQVELASGFDDSTLKK